MNASKTPNSAGPERARSTRSGYDLGLVHLAHLSLLCMALAPSTGCNFVELVPEADTVAIVAPEEAQNCERLATTHAQVTHRIWIYRRSETEVGEELDTLARNAAVEQSGNTVAPLGPVSEGRREYAIYRCAR